MADENARRAVEQEKLNTWCSRVGIESASDLAFWFTSYDQALQEAGRAVADGWDLARRESEPRMAGCPGSESFCEGDGSSVPPSSAFQYCGYVIAFIFGEAVFVCGACQAEEAARTPVRRKGGCRLSVYQRFVGHHGDADAATASPPRRVHGQLALPFGEDLCPNRGGHYQACGPHMEGLGALYGSFGSHVPRLPCLGHLHPGAPWTYACFHLPPSPLASFFA